MAYPIELLPSPGRKIFDCELSDCFLIRKTNSSDKDTYWDKKTGTLLVEAICSPRENIEDLSCNLLGTFKYEHLHIRITTAGKEKGYLEYCAPDFEATEPVITDDYILEDCGYWVVKIGKIHNMEVKYTRENKPDEFIAIGSIIHTPTRSNFWHFSLKWTTPFGSVDEMDKKEKAKVSRAIGNTARAFIANHASIEQIEVPQIPEHCYFV